MKKFSLTSLALVLLTCTTSANASDTVTNITIYGNSPQSWNMPYYYGQQNVEGYAVINFAKQATFAEGSNAVNVADVPDEIDPTSIMIKSMNRNLQVIEQNFVASKLNTADIIKRSIGKEIEVEQDSSNGVITSKGILLDSSNGLIIKEGDKVKIINNYSSVSVVDDNSAVSGNSIRWLINSAVAGDSLFEYSYKTQGISWSASYDIYLDGKGDDIMGKIEGWANLLNNTKISIKDTNLKLVAGETAQANGGPRAVPMMAMAKGAAMDMVAEAAPMQEQKFADYHMYTIDRKISLPAQSTKKIKLFDDKEGVLATKKYVYEGANGDNAVKSVITFMNDEKSRLGIPLPGGKYRVFNKDASSSYEQVGEATQTHKAEGEKVELTIGNTFDLKAERKQTDGEQDQIRHRGKYTVQVDLSNALEEEATVFVREPIYQQNWEVVSKTHPFAKINANLAEFTVTIKPKSKETLEYIVQYSW